MTMVSAMDLLSALSYFPLVGRPMVLAVLPNCSQRHKCDMCGAIKEVRLNKLLENPNVLLTESGRIKVCSEGAQCLPCVSSPTCGGRLGVHTYPGDSTNGDKDKLAQMLREMLGLMPGLVPIPSEIIASLDQDDIYFCM